MQNNERLKIEGTWSKRCVYSNIYNNQDEDNSLNKSNNLMLTILQLKNIKIRSNIFVSWPHLISNSYSSLISKMTQGLLDFWHEAVSMYFQIYFIQLWSLSALLNNDKPDDKKMEALMKAAIFRSAQYQTFIDFK